MAVNSHSPRPDVGHVLSLAMGRPPRGGEQNRGCIGRVFDRRCERGAVWLLPEVPYCGSHMPTEYLPLVVARRDLWIALAGDVWREILADLPFDGELPEPAVVPPARTRRDRHSPLRSTGWPIHTAIVCVCGETFSGKYTDRDWRDHLAAAKR